MDNQPSALSEGILSPERSYPVGDTDPSRSHAEILQCLHTSEYEEHRGRIREPVEGTCTWVTDHPKYKDWLESKTSGALWLSAESGWGKTTIASFLLNHLQNRTDATVCYFFFKDENEEQRNAEFALCAILHQIFERRALLTQYAKEEFEAKGERFTGEVDTLWNILVKVATEGGCGEIICLLDGLDECEERTRDQLIRHVGGLPRSQTRDIPLKFLVTGRPYHGIERELGAPATTISLKGEEEVSAITADIGRIVDKRIKNLESYWGLGGMLEHLRNSLKSSADRTVLWVTLILDIMDDCEDDSVEEFTEIVSTAPRDIAELYTKVLNRGKYPDRARRIASIVIGAARPLTLREMNAAFRIRREHKSVKELGNVPVNFEKSLKFWCGTFVRVINSKIYLVHQTAREFLIKGSLAGQGSWQYTLCSNDFNFLMADICVSYLSMEEFENDPLTINPSYGSRSDGVYADYLQKYPLLNYAATRWPDHFRDSQDRQTELLEFTRLICEGGSNRFLTWFKVHWVNKYRHLPFPADFTHLMTASWLGQGAVMEQLLQEEGDINARSSEYDTALNIAAFRQEEDITRMLVQKNAKAHLDGKEYNILQVRRTPRLDD